MQCQELKKDAATVAVGMQKRPHSIALRLGSRAVALGAATLVVIAGLSARTRPSEAVAAWTGVAHEARTLSLNESGYLHLTSKRGFTLNELGSASGTISGALYIHLHLVSSSRVTAEVGIYPRGSSLTGVGSASYRVNGGYAVFSGVLAITRGTGRYAHAHASHLLFTGTIQRRNDAVAVRLSGPLSY